MLQPRGPWPGIYSPLSTNLYYLLRGGRSAPTSRPRRRERGPLHGERGAPVRDRAPAAVWLAAYVVARHRVGGGQPTGFAYDLSWSIFGRYAAHELSFLNVLIAPIDSTEIASRVRALSGHAWLAIVLALASLAAGVAGVRSALRVGSSRVAASAAVLGFAWFLFGMMPFVGFADRLFGRYTYFGHAGVPLSLAGVAHLFAEALQRRGMATEPAA